MKTPHYTAEQQQANLRRSLLMGLMRDIAIARGGTGELRKPLSDREYRRRRKYRQTVKSSRVANRHFAH